MLSFISWVFWAVICLGATLVSISTLDKKKEEKDDENAENPDDSEEKSSDLFDINGLDYDLDWGGSATFVGAMVIALWSAPYGFFYLILIVYLGYLCFYCYGLLTKNGISFDENGSNKINELSQNISRNGFSKEHAPTATMVFSSIFILIISLTGFEAGTSSGSFSSSSVSKSDISKIAEGHYVSEKKVKEWIKLIGFDELKDAISDRNYECFDRNSVYCLAQGTLDEEVQKRAGTAGCKDDWKKCTSKKEFENAHFYWWLDIGSACEKAANKAEGRNVMKAYGSNAFNRYDPIKSNLGSTGKFTLYSKGMDYTCSYNLSKKKATITDKP
jgi:hypothetical protein